MSYKAYNGFKGGQSIALEKVLEVKLPRHDIKVCSYTDSHLRTLRGHFMQSKSCWFGKVVLVRIMKEIAIDAKPYA